jgi:hypothetical protein
MRETGEEARRMPLPPSSNAAMKAYEKVRPIMLPC